MKNYWIIAGIIVVVAIVGLGGLIAMNKNSGQQSVTQAVTTQPKTSPTTEVMQNTVYKTLANAKLGNLIVESNGMTLYTYAKDTSGVSNCSGQCLVNWPAFVAPSETGNFPANISVIKRSDGTLQYAWKGMPLYTFIKDKVSGDANGEGVGGVWSVVQ